MITYKKYRRIASTILLLLGFTFFLSAQNINDGNRYKENSLLSTGKWIQLKVKENAVYKLTYDDIKKQGINDPSKVKIYGYGGWMLPEDFTQQYIDDLPEVAVYINKGSDGIFNSGDYLLFYGRGVTKWAYNQARDLFEHENNPYSTFGSYFMTEGNTGPKEMEITPLPDVSPAIVPFTDFDDCVLHEKDSIAILNSGRELFGENFIVNSGNQSFTFTVPGITSANGKVRLSFAGNAKGTAAVRLSIEEREIMSLPISVPVDYYQKGYLADGWRDWDGEKKEKVTVTVSCNTASLASAYLNYIVLNMKRSLQFYPMAYTFFRNKETLRTNQPVTYSIGNPTATCQIWDITQKDDTRLMETELKDGRMQFTTLSSGNVLREYVMVDMSKSFSTPEFAGEIENQNLHALPPTDMIILTPLTYMKQAEKLAEKHRQHSGLKVTVVNHRLIFNEFSSGTPDASAYRRFIKMFYDRALTFDLDKPKYLLLFGKGLFDNRYITKDGSKLDPKHYLLSYQVKESIDEQYSYGTDDYFGFLDDNEGRNIHIDGLDIGIGRFPVSTVAQAEDAVSKVITYMENKQYGKWKSKLIFSADYTDSNSPTNFAVHAEQADRLATYMENNHPQYMLSKYYLDAYKIVTVNGKPICPDARIDLLNQLKAGCFLLNYTGHGSTTTWSGRGLLNISDVRQMNFEHLPLWITATCDFGWPDGFASSGGEAAFLNRKSGAIALFTTSRVVSSVGNYNINNQLIRHLFTKSDGKYLRLGDVLRLSKNQLGSDRNKLNFILLGDPALVLNYPEWKIQLDSINGNLIAENDTVTLRALERVTFSGVITDETGNKVDDFSGTLNASVFNGQQTLKSISRNSNGDAFQYKDYPGIIYSGNTNVKNGVFSFTFNVPLDISYSRTNGKIGLYAFDSSAKKEASGGFLRYILSGTKDGWENDSDYPEILSMFLNDESFKNGDPVNETPYFFAKVSDKYGINLAGSGIGHGIEIRIDNNPDWIYYPLNNYYRAVNDTSGVVGFSIPELPVGKRTLKFRVWNILNNSTVDSLHFTVVKGYKPAILDLTAKENPARTSTFFTLSYNLPETVLDMEVGVYDLTGRTVWIHKEKGSSGYLEQYQIEWNLIDNSGNRVPPGIYIYRATIRTANSKETTQAKKIIVLGQ